jgi:DNA-binding winged helix-turn-helix (wHTH) protein
LRRALGQDGPRLIRTIPRRGYRWKQPCSGMSASKTKQFRGARIIGAMKEHIGVGFRTPVDKGVSMSSSYPRY